MTDEYAAKFREVIASALQKLNDDLGSFCQTTHASLYLGTDAFNEFLSALDKAYRKPSSYTVSELSQHIERFLRTCPTPEPR